MAGRTGNCTPSVPRVAEQLSLLDVPPTISFSAIVTG